MSDMGDDAIDFRPEGADLGFEPEEMDSIPAGMREQGRRELVLPETTFEVDTRHPARSRTIMQPANEATEIREVERDPAAFAPKRMEPHTDPRGMVDRLSSWFMGRDPHALNGTAIGGALNAGIGLATGTALIPEWGGIEAPSLQSVSRSLGAARRGSGPSGVLSTMLPTAPRPEGMSGSAPDMRSLAPAIGAADAATLGWADEARGALDGQQARDQVRRESQLAAEQAPTEHTLGTIGGSAPYALIPGGAPTAAGRMAIAGGLGLGLGTLRGAGESLSRDAEGTLQDAVGQGAIEGLASAGTAGLAEGAAPFVQRLGQWVRDRAATAERAATQSRLEATGVWGGRAMRAADELPGGQGALAGDLRRLDVGSGNIARPDRGALMRGWIPRPERALEDAAEVTDSAAQRMRAVTERMDMAAERSAASGAREASAGGAAPGFVDTTGVADEMERAAQQLDRVPVGGPQAANAIRQQIVDPLRARGAMTFSEAWEQRRLLDRMIRAWESDPNLTTAAGRLQTARRAVSRAMDDAAAQLDPALRQAWRQANRDYSVGAFIGEHGRGAERLSVGGGIGGAAGTAINNALGSVPVAGAWAQREMAQQSRMIWPGLRAVGLENLASRLRALGPRAQRWAATLEAAQRRGGTALAAAHTLLQRRDPDYRRAIEEMEQNAGESAQEMSQ